MQISIKKYKLNLLSAVAFLFYFWQVAVIKALMPFFVALTLTRMKRAWVFALTWLFLAVSTYFFLNGYAGSHDLKVFLLLLPFLLIKAAKDISISQPIVSTQSFLFCIFFLLGFNLVLHGFALFENFKFSDSDRVRGWFLFPLVVFLYAYLDARLIIKVFCGVLALAIGFLCTGTRSASVAVAGLLILITFNLARSSVLVALALILPLVGSVLWFLMFQEMQLNNVGVRVLSMLQVINTLTPYGHGIAPDVDSFHMSNSFDHYFVPADVMILGRVYELGYVLVFILSSVMIYIMAKTRKGMVDSQFYVILSMMCVLHYNLTIDILEIAFSVLILMAMPSSKRGAMVGGKMSFRDERDKIWESKS